jgi:hypothetical protein
MKQIIFVLVIAFLSLSARSADLQKVIQDTQRMAQEPSRVTLVWWIPTEFWDLALKNNPQATVEARAQFTKAMSDYLVFAVVSADMGPLGGMSPKDRAAIEANTTLLVGGNVIAPLTKDTMSADALNFVTIMKPLMANMLGQVGQGMEFLVYPNPPKGAEKISAVKPGSFSYTAFGHRYDWSLPIGSLLPPKIDEKTKQIFPGDYLFNPYTGEKLSKTPVQPGGPASGSQPIRSETNTTP